MKISKNLKERLIWAINNCSADMEWKISTLDELIEKTN